MSKRLVEDTRGVNVSTMILVSLVGILVFLKITSAQPTWDNPLNQQFANNVAYLLDKCYSNDRHTLVVIFDTAEDVVAKLVLRNIHQHYLGGVLLLNASRIKDNFYRRQGQLLSGSHHYNIIILVKQFEKTHFSQLISKMQSFPVWNAHTRVFIVTPSPGIFFNLRLMFRYCIAGRVYNPFIVVPSNSTEPKETPSFARFKSAMSVYKYSLKPAPNHTIPQIQVEEVRIPFKEEGFFENLENLQGYPLRISVFNFTYEMIPYIDDEGNLHYKGADGYFMELVIKRMQATPKIFQSTEDSFGMRYENGTFRGAAADIADSKADIGFNSRYSKVDWLDKVEFTYPHDKADMCILVPKAKLLPLYLHIFLPFSKLTWLYIFISIPLVAILWYFIKIGIAYTHDHEMKDSLFHVWFQTYVSFISVNIHSPNTRPERLLFSFWVLFSLIITNSFQGCLISYLAVPKYLPDIDTLEELDDSGLGIFTYPSVAILLKQNNDYGIVQKLESKFLEYDDIQDFPSQMLMYGNMSAMVDEHVAFYFANRKEYVKDGFPLLHAMKECVFPQFSVFMVPRYSPLLPRFNRLIKRIVEAGLRFKWREDASHEARLTGEFAPTVALSNHDDPHPLYVAHLQTAFYFLIIGLAASSLIFVLELYHHSKATRKRKNYETPKEMYAITAFNVNFESIAFSKYNKK